MSSLSFARQTGIACLALFILMSPVRRCAAADQIIKKDGGVISGQILGVSDGEVMVASRASNGSVNKIPYHLSDIQSVTMATPAAVTQVQGATCAATVAALGPVVQEFAGLPADWVVAAMAQLAQAYLAEGQPDQARSIYNQIDSLYPGSKYHAQAVAGKAMLDLKQGKTEEALAAVQPIVDQANQDIAPSPSDGALYANAYLVYGQALEAQKKPQQALEAYLTVKTMFYQNPDLAQQADQLAQKLRAQNPGLGVD